MRAALLELAPAVATHAAVASYLRSLPLRSSSSSSSPSRRNRAATKSGSGRSGRNRAMGTSRLATAW
jgi:hypothetical protein